jgi:DNA-binding CsgD family transcriptional regulator
VIQLVVEGKSNAHVAEILSLSVKTVETYRSRVMRKLGVQSLPHLMKLAIKNGITTLD